MNSLRVWWQLVFVSDVSRMSTPVTHMQIDHLGLLVRIVSSAALCTLLATGASAQDLAAKGMAVYTAQKCSVCHAIAGAGNKKGALDGIGAKLSADDIRQWITNAPEMAAKTKAERKPVMKAYMLAKDDLDALAAYIQALK